ncbi:MarR family transcriptional regulator [Methanoregula sp. UBA64]|uniref:MarR family transcriptional regulator n=1 Tax=Methanoregula sp. UBA64 TaxID=1915554 RepID=UPI0025DA52DE|nr:MarR family transcriptional regulator [Methanoregula sp. UBA64]
MKDEDADWLIYHLLPQDKPITPEEIQKKCGLDAAVVDASLARLERYLLIVRQKGTVRVLSIGEALVACQTKYDPSLPYTIENGVIRARKQP